MAEFKESFETVAGCKTAMWRGGKGAPLLYLHGAGGVPMVQPFMEKLAERFDVIVPSHPGYGKSDDPDWLDNVQDLAFFYLDFIDHLGLDQVHLVGNSLGGWITLEIGIRDTKRLASISAAGAAGIHVKGVPKGDIFVWTPEQAAKNYFVDPKLQEHFLQMTEAMAEDDIYIRNWRTTAKLAWEPRLYNPDLYKWLHRITIPVQLVWADQDKVLPPVYAEEYAKLIPNTTTSIIPDCGHLLHVEKPDAFAGAITEFVGGLSK